MARIRTIKPEFFVSEQVADCSTNARLLFVGMWCFCDDGGIHPASTKRLKMEVFPADQFTTDEIQKWVSELLSAGLISEFSSEGVKYWHVTGWARHQKIDKPNCKYPKPSDKFDDHSTNAPRVVSDHSPPESNGEESNGEDNTNTPLTPKGGISGAEKTGSPDSGNGKPADPQPKKRSRKSKPKLTPESAARFEKFWKSYPRREGKGGATTAWLNAIAHIQQREDWPEERAHEFLMRIVEAYASSRYVLSCIVTPEGMQWIPHPATWLNGKRYDDDQASWNRTLSATKASGSREPPDVFATLREFGDQFQPPPPGAIE